MRRILSLDGGGIKGVFAASLLATVEETIAEPVASYFDLIAGTSTGGIIALGLGLGIPAAEILAMYVGLGPSVFAKGNRRGVLGNLVRPKHDHNPLREALASKFENRMIGESTVRLVIPSLNLETGEVYLYKTAHHPRFEHDYRVAAVDAALATAAAPTYFPIQRDAMGLPLVDGGIWANNPVGLAVVEAVGVLGWPREELLVLSLGCTTQAPRGAPPRRREGGLGYWLPRVVDLFMEAQSSASLGTAFVLAGHDDVLRISPIVARGRFSLDRVEDVPTLKGLGAAEARKALPQLRERYFDGPAEAFTPYHRLGVP